MDDDVALNFDFEGGLDAVTAASGQAPPPQAMPAAGQGMAAAPRGGQMRRSFRQTVCRHWLRGLCMKGNDCGFLHQYDKSRMPLCRFFARFGECREPDCIYKHSTEDIKECNMYKLGFCPNGPDCRYRHEKLPGPPPPVETHLAKLQQRYPHQKQHQQQQQQMNNQQSEGPPSRPPMNPNSNMNMQYDQNGPGKPHQQQQKMMSAASPLPYGYSRYFIVKSSNRENLELSVQRGVWATHKNNEAKLNDAVETCDHVILIFSVNETRHFQGCAKMLAKVGAATAGFSGWKLPQRTYNYGQNFRLKWLKLCELSFNKTRHLHNPYNENLPVKISRDCQEIEPSVGQQLAELLYMEPDSQLMVAANEAEAKRDARSGSDEQDTSEQQQVLNNSDEEAKRTADLNFLGFQGYGVEMIQPGFAPFMPDLASGLGFAGAPGMFSMRPPVGPFTARPPIYPKRSHIQQHNQEGEVSISKNYEEESQNEDQAHGRSRHQKRMRTSEPV